MPFVKPEDALKQYDLKYFTANVEGALIQGIQKRISAYITTCQNAIDDSESEEHLKNIMNAFLSETFYFESRYQINTYKRVDSAIYDGQKLLALVEVKKPSNGVDMVSLEDINKKALHELIFYYLKRTRDASGNKIRRQSDVEIRRLVITDTLNWFLFDTNDIEKICDGYLEKHFYKYVNRQLIYAEDAEKFYADIKDHLGEINVIQKLPFVHFDIREYILIKKCTVLYKVLCPSYLLKSGYNSEINAQALNNKFYQELLYLMGLCEVKNKDSVTIEIDHNVRNSLADQVYSILRNDNEYDEITAIEKTFELVIIWMSRLLFIKLFEGRLISFNGNHAEYHILDEDKISSFQDLQDLFFEVLGKKDRHETVFLYQFKSIPYLNSSLFERYEVERRDININELHNNPLKIKKNSVTPKKDKTEIPLLEYLLLFLNSYDFSSQLGEENTLVEGRDIIDASVLGLIFEKLNGYKDGSFYTPSVITEYMSRRSIEKVVVQKINRKYRWNCSELFEIKYRIDASLVRAKEINELINNIKIVDIAAGSGHFLVSALNRIIVIKKQLGVLFKYAKNELLTEYDIECTDDILRIFDGQGKPFRYSKENALSQQIQETLFNEKLFIIENCLFGVDINSKAVAICQLRLWIELLKNAYYKNGVMETLPNIDINIKIGNSLISKLDFTIGSRVGSRNAELEKSVKKSINEYKRLVSSYKSTSDKSEKTAITTKITKIKSYLHREYTQIGFYEDANRNVVYDYGTADNIYEDAFEWAIEFPELLSDDGRFMGFDCILGNPPYGLLNKKQNQNTSISVSPAIYKYYQEANIFEPAKGGILNIYRLFICRCIALLQPEGYCCLIFPLAFMCDLTASKIREYILRNTTVDFIEAFPERDNENRRVFKEVKMSVCILGAINKNTNAKHRFNVRINRDRYVDETTDVMSISLTQIRTIDNNSLTIPLISYQPELRIFLAMSENSKRLVELSRCYTGEIDLTLQKQYVTISSNDALMLRGAQVQKFHITNDISQGDLLYLKADDYMQSTNGEKSRHHERRRIVMQGITGVNEKWRLKMTIAYPPYFCANSVNYLLPSEDGELMEYLLGILNSHLINWYFTKLSTNSNVNGYEIETMPIRISEDDKYDQLVNAVRNALEAGSRAESENCLEKIDELVYKIYNINDEQRSLIESGVMLN